MDAGIGGWPHRRRVKSAGMPALRTGDRTVTYDELERRVDRLAQGFAERGVRKGDRVAYLGENSSEFVAALFAVCSLGAVFVPLNTRLAPPELNFILHDCGATVLLHDAELTDQARSAANLSDLSWTAVVDGIGPDSLDALVEAADVVKHVDRDIDLDDAAMILYTSGTTGHPKGAVLSHGNITWNCMNVLVDYDLASTSVSLMISPMFHVASLTMGVLPTLLKGGLVVLETRFDPQRVLQLVEQHGVTSMSGVPTTYQMLCEHPAWASADLSSLRTLTCGGSAVPQRVAEAYERRGLSFTSGYGMTETSPGATSLQPRYSAERLGSAGLPHFFTDVRVVDGAGDPVDAGVVGEIQIQGPNVMTGYWHRPDATADSMAPGGWFRSGDLGYQDVDGFLYVTDRLKDMFISGGENVYPAEVEEVILELEPVAGVAVIGVRDDRWGEVPRAFVQLRPGALLEEVALLGHLEGRVARYKIPKTVIFVDELPRTATGKIRKADLRGPAGSDL